MPAKKTKASKKHTNGAAHAKPSTPGSKPTEATPATEASAPARRSARRAGGAL